MVPKWHHQRGDLVPMKLDEVVDLSVPLWTAGTGLQKPLLYRRISCNWKSSTEENKLDKCFSQLNANF